MAADTSELAAVDLALTATKAPSKPREPKLIEPQYEGTERLRGSVVTSYKSDHSQEGIVLETSEGKRVVVLHASPKRYAGTVALYAATATDPVSGKPERVRISSGQELPLYVLTDAAALEHDKREFSDDLARTHSEYDTALKGYRDALPAYEEALKQYRARRRDLLEQRKRLADKR